MFNKLPNFRAKSLPKYIALFFVISPLWLNHSLANQNFIQDDGGEIELPDDFVIPDNAPLADATPTALPTQKASDVLIEDVDYLDKIANENPDVGQIADVPLGAISL